MKNLFYLCVSVLLAGCAANAAPGYNISGSSKNVTGKVYLQVLEGKTPKTLDSVVIGADGSFTFSGSLAAPMFAQISDSNGKKVGNFFIENSAMSVSLTPSEEPSISVKGSLEDSLYRTMMAPLMVVESEAAYDSVVRSFVKNNPQSVAAAYVMFRMLSPGLESDQIREYVAAFDSSVQQSIYLIKALERATLMDNSAVGKKFIDFSLPNVDGTLVKLSDVAGKGDKWVLLDFWASWCSPCRAENPEVVRAFEEFGSQGFTVFGVSLDKDRAAWIDAIGKDKLNWVNVSDLKFWDCVPAREYGVSSIPSNVLISPDGTISARNLRGSALHSKLSEIFASSKQ